MGEVVDKELESQDGDTELSFEERIQPEIELINDENIKAVIIYGGAGNLCNLGRIIN